MLEDKPRIPKNNFIKEELAATSFETPHKKKLTGNMKVTKDDPGASSNESKTSTHEEPIHQRSHSQVKQDHDEYGKGKRKLRPNSAIHTKSSVEHLMPYQVASKTPLPGISSTIPAPPTIKKKRKSLIHKTAKDIMTTYIYNPPALQKCLIKKSELIGMGPTHPSNYNPAMFVQSNVSCINMLRKSIKERYIEVFEQFVKGKNPNMIPSLVEEIQQIRKQCMIALETAEILFGRTSNKAARTQAEKLQALLFQASQFDKSLASMCQGRKRVLEMVKLLDEKKTLEKMLKNFQIQKQKQLDQIFQNHHNTKPVETEIIDRIHHALDEVIGDTLTTVNNISDMKFILESVSKYLEQSKKKHGIGGLSKVNKIFKQILQFGKKFDEKIGLLDKDNQLMRELNPQMRSYNAKLMEDKQKILGLMMSIMETIFTVMAKKLRENYSINHVVTEKCLSFTHIQSALREVSETFVQEKMEQGTLIRNFLDSTSNLLDESKLYHKKLISMKNSIMKGRTKENKIEELKIEEIADLREETMRYKQKMARIIFEFEKVNHNLTGNKGQEPVIMDNMDDEIQYIDRLISQISNQEVTEQKLVFYVNDWKQNAADLYYKDKREKVKQDLRNQLENINRQKLYIEQTHAGLTPNLIINVIGAFQIDDVYIERIDVFNKTFLLIESLSKPNVIQKSKQIIQCLRTIPSDSDQNRFVTQYFFCHLSEVFQIEQLRNTLTNSRQQEFKTVRQDIKSKSTQFKQNKYLFEQTAKLFEPLENKQINEFFDEKREVYLDIQRIKELFSNNNLCYPNVEFVERIGKAMFDVMMVVDSMGEDAIIAETNKKIINDQIYVSQRVLRCQVEKLDSMMQKSSFDYIKEMARYLISKVKALEQSLTDFVSLEFSEQQKRYAKYCQFLSSAINLLSNTCQVFFTLLDNIKNPIFISRVQNRDYFGLVSQILTGYMIPHNQKSLFNFKKFWQIETAYLKKVERREDQKVIKIDNEKKRGSKNNRIPEELKEQVVDEHIMEDVRIIEDIGEEIKQSEHEDIDEDIGEDFGEVIEDNTIGEAIQTQEVIADQIEQDQPKKHNKAPSASKTSQPNIQNIRQPNSNFPLSPIFVLLTNIQSIQFLIQNINRSKLLSQSISKLLQEHPSFNSALVKLSSSLTFTLDKSQMHTYLRQLSTPLQSIKSQIETELKQNLFKELFENNERFAGDWKKLNKMIRLLDLGEKFDLKVYREFSEDLDEIWKKEKDLQLLEIVSQGEMLLRVPKVENSNSILIDYISQPLMNLNIGGLHPTQQSLNKAINCFFKQKSNQTYQLVNLAQLNIQQNNRLKQLLSDSNNLSITHYDTKSIQQLFRSLMNYCWSRSDSNLDQQKVKRNFEKVKANLRQELEKKKKDLRDRVEKSALRFVIADSVVEDYLKKVEGLHEEMINKLQNNILNNQMLISEQADVIQIWEEVENSSLMGNQSENHNVKKFIENLIIVHEQQKERKKKEEEEERKRQIEERIEQERQQELQRQKILQLEMQKKAQQEESARQRAIIEEQNLIIMQQEEKMKELEDAIVQKNEKQQELFTKAQTEAQQRQKEAEASRKEAQKENQKAWLREQQSINSELKRNLAKIETRKYNDAYSEAGQNAEMEFSMVLSEGFPVDRQLECELDKALSKLKDTTAINSIKKNVNNGSQRRERKGSVSYIKGG